MQEVRLELHFKDPSIPAWSLTLGGQDFIIWLGGLQEVLSMKAADEGG